MRGKGAVLLPNLGAEEGDESTAARPGYPDAAALWLLLFSAPSRAIDRGAPLDTPFDRTRPVFPWLEDEGGGVPWLSTERAARRLLRLGLRPAAVDPDIVHEVHDKAFALEVALEAGWLDPELSRSLTIFSPDDLSDPAGVEAVLAGLPAWTDDWVLKPRFGSSGRGRVPGKGRRLEAVAAAGLPRLARRGGAILEPWLPRIADLSAQLHLGDEGPTLLGSTRQILAHTGVYQGNRGIVEGGRIRAGTPWDDELETVALQMGKAVWSKGFRGPCGLDAFVYTGPDGGPIFRPVVEFNARFTMGTVALGLVHRAWEVGIGREAGAFRFLLRGGASEGALGLGADSTLAFASEPEGLD